jgi:hypothetical protein
MALAGAKVAARTAQQAKPPTAAKPAKKGTRLVKPEASSAVAASPLKEPPVVQRVQNGVSTHKTSSSAQAASNGRKSDPKALDQSGDQPLKTPAAMMTKTIASPPRGEADDDDDKWDLDALVKKTVGKAVGKKTERAQPVLSGDVADPEDADHDYSDSEFVGKQFRNHQMHLFSQLIDEAARERWELVEVGRLVRIFAAQWGHKKTKTARFLRRCCPELVSVEFLEGMNIPLDTKQLLKIFERGSGTPVVVMNKIASAVENGNMTVRDEDLQSFIVDQTQLMPTNRDIIEFLLPLLESLSKVKDVGVLLKAICEHWHVDRTVALVQDILLTPVFDDLDGQPDVILEDLPALEGRLDFPSCMDDEDADENGNLKGLIVGEESDLGESDAHPEDAVEEALGEIESDDDDDGNDSHAEDGVYEGETDSEEEREAQERMNPTKRRRSRFILDEADEDDEGDDGSGDDFLADEDEGEDGDSDSSGDSSDDEGASTKPQRKRLRKG